MRSLMPAMSAGVMISLSPRRLTWRVAEIGGGEDLEVHLVGHHGEHLLADRPVEHRLLVRGIADEIAGREDRPLVDLARDVLRGDEGHVEIAALHGADLGALLEERRAEMDLELEIGCRRLQLLLHHGQHLGVPVAVDGRGRDAQLGLLGACRAKFAPMLSPSAATDTVKSLIIDVICLSSLWRGLATIVLACVSARRVRRC